MRSGIIVTKKSKGEGILNFRKSLLKNAANLGQVAQLEHCPDAPKLWVPFPPQGTYKNQPMNV